LIDYCIDNVILSHILAIPIATVATVATATPNLPVVKKSPNFDSLSPPTPKTYTPFFISYSCLLALSPKLSFLVPFSADSATFFPTCLASFFAC